MRGLGGRGVKAAYVPGIEKWQSGYTASPLGSDLMDEDVTMQQELRVTEFRVSYFTHATHFHVTYFNVTYFCVTYFSFVTLRFVTLRFVRYSLPR